MPTHKSAVRIYKFYNWVSLLQLFTKSTSSADKMQWSTRTSSEGTSARGSPSSPVPDWLNGWKPTDCLSTSYNNTQRSAYCTLQKKHIFTLNQIRVHINPKKNPSTCIAPCMVYKPL